MNGLLLGAPGTDIECTMPVYRSEKTSPRPERHHKSDHLTHVVTEHAQLSSSV